MVTGASSGIGEATARALAALGAKVVITSEKTAEIEAIAQSIEDAGGCALPFAADFAEPDQIEGLIARAEQAAGPLDILINNAGVGMRAMIGELPMADIRHLFEVNFFALATLCAEALPRMAKRGAGRIINISSAAGQFGSAGFSAYAANKGAVHTYTQALRVEALAKGIYVSEVVPISVRTPFFDNVRGKSYRPLGVVLTPEAVARSIVHCAQSDSSPGRKCVRSAGIRLVFLLNAIAPWLLVRFNTRALFERNKRDEEARRRSRG